jgi:succinoglycan biosynthesis protein ExoM
MKDRICVCVATFKRDKQLKLCIESLLSQKTGDRFDYSILVVDNDKERSAEQIVRHMATGKVDVYYHCEPERNISLARNMCIEKSTGNYIAFLDDDEQASEDWLYRLWEFLTFADVDMVHGRVITKYENHKSCVKRSKVYEKYGNKTGSAKYYHYSTNNCLIRKDILERSGIKFRKECGRRGGEDVFFFKELFSAGYTRMWVEEAVVVETLCSERDNYKWLFSRALRLGYLDAKDMFCFLTRRQLMRFVVIMIMRTGYDLLCLLESFFLFNYSYFLECLAKVLQDLGFFSAFTGKKYAYYT